MRPRSPGRSRTVAEARQADRRTINRAAVSPLSASRIISMAQIESRVRAAGSEFVLACDMSFAARESAIFCQMEPALGVLPGGGAAQHLTRLMGRSRALEVMLSAQDYDAGLAEQYGWINRALPADELGDFVRSLAHRIAGFPPAASPPSSSASTRSRWRRWRNSAATRISSAKGFGVPNHKAGFRPR